MTGMAGSYARIFSVRWLTQIAYAKEKLPLVRIAAKVWIEPKVHDAACCTNDRSVEMGKASTKF
jgi:hypothetical protein